MPRTLPWEKPPPQKSSDNAPRKRVHRWPALDDEDDRDEGSMAASSPWKGKARADRAPSSSPPLVPRSPPRVEYMQEGLQGDDIWVMVEDELMDTAKLFTQHLHRAEYRRLKEQAKTQRGARARTLARPTSGKSELSTEAKKRAEAEAKEHLQEAALRDVAVLKGRPTSDDDDDDFADAPFLHDPQLSSLMRRRPPQARALSRAVGAKVNTRAALGFAGPRRASPKRRAAAMRTAGQRRMAALASELGMASASEGEEGLNAVVLFKPTPGKRSPSPPKKPAAFIPRTEFVEPTGPDHRRLSGAAVASASHSKPDTLMSASASSTSRWADPERVPSKELNTPSASRERLAQRPRDMSVTQQIAKRKATKAQHADTPTKKKPISLDEIPTFMF